MKERIRGARLKPWPSWALEYFSFKADRWVFIRRFSCRDRDACTEWATKELRQLRHDRAVMTYRLREETSDDIIMADILL